MNLLKREPTVDSAASFIATCDQFTKLLRILGWIACAVSIVAMLHRPSGERGSGLILSCMFLVIVSYFIIELSLLSLRFMREIVILLREIRNRS